MIRGRFGATRRDVVRLFEGGSVAGLGDGELLERFALTRDEAAFEALVSKLGPMVLGVCRRMLADPHDVDDAFQATFLVLVKRAPSIRDRDLVAPWLHGVATRVARRARADSLRRSARERVAVVVEAREDLGSEWPELRAMIDEEIERLPEHHRRPVVLCDVEGLTREEAAIRLGWTLNMVRGRLERARERLRARLTRRGLTPAGGYLAVLANAPHLSPAILATTCRAALAFGAGRLGSGLATASAVALSEGVLKMMMLSKLKLGLAVALTMGFVGGTGMLAAQAPGAKQDPGKAEGVPAPAPVVQEPAKDDVPFQPRGAADLAKARIDAAQQRLDAQMQFYNEGRITIDRLIDASEQLMHAKLDAAETKASRIEIVRAHYEVLKGILNREQAELADGRATQADVAEAKTKLLDAEFLLARELVAPENPGTRSMALAKLAAQRVEIARRMSENARELYRNARIEYTSYLDAVKSLLEAEEAAATTRDERIRAIQGQIKVLEEGLVIAKSRIEPPRGNSLAVDQIRLKILEAEARLIEVSEAPGSREEGIVPRPEAITGTRPPVNPEPVASPTLARLAAERLEIARRMFQEAEKQKQAGAISTTAYNDAHQFLLEAEEKAATTKAIRVAAIEGQIKILKDQLSLMERTIQQGQNSSRSLDLFRLKILDAETHLIEVSEAPEGPGVSVLPASGGSLPTTRAGEPGSPAGLTDERVEAAKKSYESVFNETVKYILSPPVGVGDNSIETWMKTSRAEMFYLWSRRWMEAQRDAGGGSKEAEILAIEGHLNRMKELERGKILEALYVKFNKPLDKDQLVDDMKIIPEFQNAIKFYRLEAEAWLAKAKAR